MSTRTLTGTVYQANGNTPWARSVVGFALIVPFAADQSYPKHTYNAITAADGTFTVALAVPDTGTAQYTATLPNGTTITFYLAAGVGNVTLESIVNGAYSVPADPGTVAALIAAHAAVIASTAQLGHIKPDGVTITVDPVTGEAVSVGGGGGVTDHGALTGLADDDHSQYLNQARGDARYYTEAETDAFIAGRASDAELAAHVALTLASAHGGLPPLELALCFVENGDLEFVASSARSYTAVIERGTGTITYTKALSAAPTVFSADTLPLDLAAGDVLRITCAGRSGYKALTLTGTLV